MPAQSPRPDFIGVSDSRRRNMAAIAGKHTQPEMLVRRTAHALGYRYRLHVKELPGCPDLVFPGLRKIIEVRGCFWHRHPCCQLATTPKTRAEFWQAKFRATIARDVGNAAALVALGWTLLVIWECEISDDHLRDRLRSFLGPRRDQMDTIVC